MLSLKKRGYLTCELILIVVSKCMYQLIYKLIDFKELLKAKVSEVSEDLSFIEKLCYIHTKMTLLHPNFGNLFTPNFRFFTNT